jgi:hypothetical protein
MTGGHQHYYPAALIGAFGEREDGIRSRRRHVWATLRESNTVERRRAESLGKDPINRRPYTPATGFDLDTVWQKNERLLTVRAGLLDALQQGRPLAEVMFVNAVVPFFSHLLTRHPALFGAGVGGILDPHSSTAFTDNLATRGGMYWIVQDNLLYSSRWELQIAHPAEHYVGSDLGFTFLPGPAPGEFFFPLDTRRGISIYGASSGASTYYVDDAEVHIPARRLSRGETRLRKALISYQAPRQVYVDTEQRAEASLRLMRDRASISLRGTPRIALDGFPDPRTVAFLAQWNGADDPTWAFARFHAAAKKFGCTCAEALGARGADQRQIDQYLARVHDDPNIRASLPSR